MYTAKKKYNMCLLETHRKGILYTENACILIRLTTSHSRPQRENYTYLQNKIYEMSFYSYP